jgi:hypothetical protein
MYNALVKITTYKNYLIITLLDKAPKEDGLLNKNPKIRNIGVGTQFVGFHKKDLLISNEALEIFKSKALEDKKEDPAMELINPYNLWWRGEIGLILPINEIINVYAIPHHTICENYVDVKVKEIIEK